MLKSILLLSSLFILASCSRDKNSDSTVLSLNFSSAAKSKIESQNAGQFFPTVLIANVHYDGQVEKFEWHCPTRDSQPCTSFPSSVNFGNKEFPSGGGRIVQVLMVYANQAEQLRFYYGDALGLNFNSAVLNVSLGVDQINTSGREGQISGRFMDSVGRNLTASVEGLFSPPNSNAPPMLIFNNSIFNGHFSFMLFDGAPFTYKIAGRDGRVLFDRVTLRDFEGLNPDHKAIELKIPQFVEIEDRNRRMVRPNQVNMGEGTCSNLENVLNTDFESHAYCTTSGANVALNFEFDQPVHLSYLRSNQEVSASGDVYTRTIAKNDISFASGDFLGDDEFVSSGRSYVYNYFRSSLSFNENQIGFDTKYYSVEFLNIGGSGYLNIYDFEFEAVEFEAEVESEKTYILGYYSLNTPSKNKIVQAGDFGIAYPVAPVPVPDAYKHPTILNPVQNGVWRDMRDWQMNHELQYDPASSSPEVIRIANNPGPYAGCGPDYLNNNCMRIIPERMAEHKLEPFFGPYVLQDVSSSPDNSFGFLKAEFDQSSDRIRVNWKHLPNIEHGIDGNLAFYFRNPRDTDYDDSNFPCAAFAKQAAIQGFADFNQVLGTDQPFPENFQRPNFITAEVIPLPTTSFGPLSFSHSEGNTEGRQDEDLKVVVCPYSNTPKGIFAYNLAAESRGLNPEYPEELYVEPMEIKFYQDHMKIEVPVFGDRIDPGMGSGNAFFNLEICNESDTGIGGDDAAGGATDCTLFSVPSIYRSGDRYLADIDYDSLDVNDLVHIRVTYNDPDGYSPQPGEQVRFERIPDPSTLNTSSIEYIKREAMSSTELKFTVKISGDANGNANVKLFWCNQTDNSMCYPPDDGAELTLTNASGGFFSSTLSDLSSLDNPGDSLSIEAVLEDSDNGYIDYKNIFFTIPKDDGTQSNFDLVNISKTSSSENDFSIIIQQLGIFNTNTNGFGVLRWCNATKNPGCNPLVNGFDQSFSVNSPDNYISINVAVTDASSGDEIRFVIDHYEEDYDGFIGLPIPYFDSLNLGGP